MRRRRFRRVAIGAATLLCTLTTACGDEAAPAPTVTRETVGDTTIVRVAGAGPWGDAATVQEELRIGELDGADEYTFGRISGLVVDDDGAILVLDDQADQVRVYGADGLHMRTFGRSGAGPGELKDASGMVRMPDGRIAVRDFGNARINTYSPAGEPLETYAIPSGYYTSAPLYVDRAGNLYTQVIVDREMIRADLGRIDTTGTMRDTLMSPPAPEVPSLRAERVSREGRSRSITSVPFWPTSHSTLSLDGTRISGFSDRYAISVEQPDGTVLRMERVVEPVPVDPAEARASVERIERSMRDLEEGWSWSGPQPPATKPLFRGLVSDVDGRVWVQLSRSATRVPPDPDAEPDSRGRMPVERWVEELAYDVWDPDGELLGTVVMPERFEMMFARGDFVWGVVRDEYDVQYVVRLRIVPQAPAA